MNESVNLKKIYHDHAKGIVAKCILLQSLWGFRKIVQNEQIGPEVVHKYVERFDLLIA